MASRSLSRTCPPTPLKAVPSACAARPIIKPERKRWICPPGLQLSFENEPSWRDREFIDEALGVFNAPFLQDPSYSYFGLLIRDASGTIRAGLIGSTYAGWLFTQLLWVAPELRRIGVGGGLIREAERHARSQNCHSAFVDTFSFQAPGFYRRQGYREFARLPYPPSHDRIFLQKQLEAADAYAP